jgi:hypothetical protein
MEIRGKLKEWLPPMDVRSAPLSTIVLARWVMLSFRMHTNSTMPNLALVRVASR